MSLSAMAAAATAAAVVHYAPVLTHEQYFLRVPSIPSTIQFRMAHPPPHISDDLRFSVADISEDDLCTLAGDDEAYRLVKKLITDSPMAAKMTEQDLEDTVWDVVEWTIELVTGQRDAGVVRNMIWIVKFEIEVDDDDERTTEDDIEELERLVKETPEGRCGICFVGIPVSWMNDFCPSEKCPSRGTDRSTLLLDVVM